MMRCAEVTAQVTQQEAWFDRWDDDGPLSTSCAGCLLLAINAP